MESICGSADFGGKMRVLITGINGLLGKDIAKVLLQIRIMKYMEQGVLYV